MGKWGSGLSPGSVGVACSHKVLRINLGFEPALDTETIYNPIKRNIRVLLCTNTP